MPVFVQCLNFEFADWPVSTMATMDTNNEPATASAVAPASLTNENGSIADSGNNADGPSSFGPPSPLTGCYLLIVLGEPHSDKDKDIILHRLLKGNSF